MTLHLRGIARRLVGGVLMLCALAGAGVQAQSTSADAAVVLPQLEVEAPEGLRELLSEFLDVARALRMPDAHTLGDGEWARLISNAPEQAQSLARTRGYFAAKASASLVRGQPAPGCVAQSTRPTEVGALADPTPVCVGDRIVVKLQAGPQARVARLTFEVQGELAQAVSANNSAAEDTLADLRTQWPLPVGALFDGNDWTQAKANTLARLRAAGYATASWSGTGAEVLADLRSVHVFVVADSGPLFLAGDIVVEGLKMHSAEQVQALSGFGRGAALTETRLLDYQDRLQKTGLFDQVAVTLDPDPAQAGAARVLVQVHESPLHGLSLALGASTNSGPRTTIEHVYRRVFGLAAFLRNKIVFGRDAQGWDAEISSHPDDNFNRNLIGVLVSQTLSSTDLVLSQQLRIGRSQESPRMERLNFYQVERSRECDRVDSVSVLCTELIAQTLNTHTTWRRLDNPILPTEGFVVQTQVGGGWADSNRADNGPFGRVYMRAMGYWPLGNTWYSRARLEVGRVGARSSLDIPDSQLFRAGGDESVRGYAYRSLAPASSDGTLYGGRNLLTGTAEIARPITRNLPNVWWATFVDAGRASNGFADFKPAWGYGLGVRWRSPAGPLQLDWAWADEDGRGRLHLSVGIAF